MAEGGSNDGGDDNDVAGGDGKRKVGCEGEVDDDGDDNDNGGVDDDSGVDNNDGNDAKGGDSISKTVRDDDGANGGGSNSNDFRSVDWKGIFGKWCVDGKSSDEADDCDEQTESVAGDLTECNGTSKMEMRVGVMQ